MSKRTGRKYKKTTPRRRKYNRPYPGGYNPVDGGRVTGMIPKVNSGFTLPKSKRVKLKYGHHVDFSNNLSATYEWKANSAYDPDKTSIGNQPLGFDQWASFYSKYIVHASKFKVTVSTGGAPLVCGLYPDYDGNGGSITIPHLIDKPESTYMMVAKNDGSQSMEYYCKIQDYFGLSKPLTSQDLEYGAPTSTDPDKTAIMAFKIESLDLNLVQVNALFEITYYVEFYEPKELGQS